MKEITSPPPYQHFGSELSGGASPDRRVTTEKKKAKSLENSLFSRLFGGAGVDHEFRKYITGGHSCSLYNLDHLIIKEYFLICCLLK